MEQHRQKEEQMNTQQLIMKLTGGKPNKMCPDVIEIGRCDISKHRSMLYELAIGSVGADSETVYGVSIFCILRASSEEKRNWRKLSRVFNSLADARGYIADLPHIVYDRGESMVQVHLDGIQRDPGIENMLKDRTAVSHYLKAKKWKVQEVQNE
jgi:hypothetical protein